MPFITQNWGFISPSGNIPQQELQGGTIIGAPGIYTYQSQNETLATIASDVTYFAPVDVNLFAQDLIYIAGSDSAQWFEVQSVDTETGNVIIAQHAGVGNVTGPATSTLNALARYGNTSGDLIKNSTAILDDSGNLTGLGNITAVNATLTTTSSFTLPAGTTGQRAGSAGSIRYNTTSGMAELTNDGATWSVITTASSGVFSVTGTANRITSTGGANPIIDIAATYVGQNSITTLGIVTTGTWNGTNIALNHGGTNGALTASLGGIVWSDASQMQILSGTATARQMLQSGASATPAWSTATWPATTTINRILYSSANNTISEITAANNGVLVSGATGVPSMLAGPGTTGNILQSVASGAPAFSTAAYPTTTTANQILYSSTTDTVTGLPTVNAAALTTNSTGVPTYVAINDGQIVIGSTAGSPAAATLTAGSGISITNASNSITIATSGSGFSTVVVTGTTQTLAKETRYIANNNISPIVFTLPATAAVGDTFSILDLGGGGWSVAQNSGQKILVSSLTSTTGAGGSIATTSGSDQVTLICAVTNTTFISTNVQGFITVV